jgi:hypothetical protein
MENTGDSKIKELQAKLEAWEKCAENLVDYAHEFVHQLSLWGQRL